MKLDTAKITEGYGDRARRLGLFSFLFGLQSKIQKDANGKRIDFLEIGFLSLLFFFENMLMRNYKTSTTDLAKYLRIEMSKQYDLTDEQYVKIAYAVISTFRPTSGERPKYHYFDWEQNREDVVEYYILKSASADASTGTQYYALDRDGLELIFATKEYFSEFQISINQLLLRKQLDKGEFDAALRQIKEMDSSVLALKDKIVGIRQEIQRNIVSEETYERYKKTIEDINSRLKRENIEFSEIAEYVRDMQSKFDNNIEALGERESKAYSLMIKIDTELNKVHFEHKKLLDESFSLERTALRAARESIYLSVTDSFNFNREITNMVFSLPIPVEEVRILCEPLLFLKRTQSFNPLRIFAEQPIKAEQKESLLEFVEPMGEKEYTDYLKMCSRQYGQFMNIVLGYMGGNLEIELREIIQNAITYNPEILEDRDFFDMFMVLHQKSPVVIGYDEDDKMETLFSGISKILKGYKTLVVTEKMDILEVKNIRIQNMLVSLVDFT